MKIKNIMYLGGILAIGSAIGYGVTSRKFFEDVLKRGKSSVANDNTNYSDLDTKNYQARDEWMPTVTYHEVTTTSFDGLKLHGYCFEQDSNKPWIIAIHGYKVNAISLMASAKVFYENGYNVLVIDQRSHGKSEGIYIGMGWIERKDIHTWITYLTKKNANCKIALYGVSMGAATVMMTVGDTLPNNVVCAIEDCGYTSVSDILLDQAYQKYNLSNPIFFSGFNYLCKKHNGFSIYEASCLTQLKNSITPTLFIHGKVDAFVPFEMVYHNYEACQSEKELLIIEGQGHALACLDENYYPAVLSFIKKYI